LCWLVLLQLRAAHGTDPFVPSEARLVAGRAVVAELHACFREGQQRRARHSETKCRRGEARGGTWTGRRRITATVKRRKSGRQRLRLPSLHNAGTEI
jgi:hypothetical protein